MESPPRMAKDRENQPTSYKLPPHYVKAPANLLLDQRLKAVDKVVWLYLRWRQGKNSSAWPGQERIAKDLHLAVNTMKGSLGRLPERGWLEINPAQGSGRGHRKYYTVKKGSKIDTFKAEKGIKNCLTKGSKTDYELYTSTIAPAFAVWTASGQADANSSNLSEHERVKAKMDQERKEFVERHRPKDTEVHSEERHIG